MTLKQFDAQMSIYENELKNNYTYELFEEVSQFQSNFMSQLCDKYLKSAHTDAQRLMCELIDNVIRYSTTGQTAVYTDKKTAMDLDNVLAYEIGDLLLDCSVYNVGNDKWAVDVVFGGFYTPYWDGFCD